VETTTAKAASGSIFLIERGEDEERKEKIRILALRAVCV